MTTIDAAEALKAAEARYEEAERALALTLSRTPTAETYLRERELRHELEAAARGLVAAKDDHHRALGTENAERERAARAKLAEAEDELRRLIPVAERQAEALAATLKAIVAASRNRYAAHHDAVGSAPRSFLAKPGIVGWLQHRLADVDLPDLGRAGRHHRTGLGSILGLDPRSNTGEVQS